MREIETVYKDGDYAVLYDFTRPENGFTLWERIERDGREVWEGVEKFETADKARAEAIRRNGGKI